MRTNLDRPSRTPALTVALVAFALFGALPLPGFAQEDGRSGADAASDTQESTASIRTANEEELEKLLDDFDAAEKEKTARAMSAALERLAAFNNPELLECAEEGFDYKASRADKKEAKREAESLGMEDKEAIAKLVELRVADVVDAAAKLCVAIGDEDSLDELVDALGDRDVWESIPKVSAVVDALARHDLSSEKADEKIVEILLSIDKDDYAGDDFWGHSEEQFAGYERTGRYRAAIRYFGQRRTKDLDVVMNLANLLHAPDPGHVDSPDNPPASYWKARFESWQRYSRDVVWALKQITGQTWKPGYEDEGGEGEIAKRWIAEHAERLGLE